MYKCKKCELEFSTATSLVSHLTHPKSKCKINIKEYYDNFLRKEGEGICQFCGRETSFASIEKGYINNTCKHCRNNKSDSKLKRKENYNQKREIKKIESGYYNLKEQCQLCLKDVRFKTREGLSKHIWQIHKDISIKEYYNQFIKTDPLEGICKISGEKTSFIDLSKGYCKYKFKGSNFKDEEVKDKKKKTNLEKWGVENVMMNPDISKKHSGSNSHFWNPNREEVFSPYTERFFDKEFRQQILKEQNFLDPLTDELLPVDAHLHHIDYNKLNDSRENLIFLSHSTHAKTNTNRDEWKNLLEKVNQEIIIQ